MSSVLLLFQPSPGMHSRPDRILVSAQDYYIISAQVNGADGDIYKYKYYYHVLWNRLESVLAAMRDSTQGKHGRSCLHDCGPHASCRCGVCVSGGDTNSCMLPFCHECDSSVYQQLLLSVVVLVVIVVHFVFATIQVLLMMNEQSSMSSQLLPMSMSSHSRAKKQPFVLDCGFCKICLFDPKMYTDASVRFRRWKRRTLCRIYPVLKLPPMVLLMFSIVALFIFIEAALVTFRDTIADIYAIIPEEWHASDHLILSAKVQPVKFEQ